MKNKIKLGLLAPLSGLVELYGPEIARAGAIACDEVNARGGVLGQQLELVIRDDGSMPETAIPAARHLIEKDGCTAIIGNLLSNSRIAVCHQVAEPLKVPQLNFSFYEGSLYSPYFFNFAALPNQQIDRMIPYMARNHGSKMFFAGSNYEWPLGSIDAAKRALIKVGGEIVGEEYLPLGTTDMTELIKKVARSGADVFVPYFAGSDQIALLEAFTQSGLKNKMAVVMGHFDEAMVSKMSAKVREGFYSSNTYFMSIDTLENKTYLDAMLNRPEVTGIWPHGNGVLTNFGEGAYLCVHAFAKALNSVGSLNTADMLSALRTIKLNGPQGEVVMDPDTQHAKVNSYLTRCRRDGSFEIVESFGTIPPVIPERYLENFQSAAAPPQPKESIATPPTDLSDYSRADKRDDLPLLHIADIGIIITDANGIISFSNIHSDQMFGYHPHELEGLPISILIPPRFRHIHDAHFQDFRSSGNNALRMNNRNLIYGYRKDGAEFPIDVSLARIDLDGQPTLMATFKDATKRKKQEERLIQQATHDHLTSLPNRALIMERITNALLRSQRSESAVSVLFVDLDNFKLINDSYGHTVGDKLLIDMADRLLDSVRTGDTVARIGGDEFVVLCEHVTDPATTSELAHRILKDMRAELNIDGLALFPSVSIGIAIGYGKTHDAETLLRNADTAMYKSKDRGRNNWTFFSDELQQQAQSQLDLSNGLKSAIENNEFYLVYQPIFNPHTNALVGAEALLRWTRADGTVISPTDFIPIAEATGSILSIGLWVLETTCRTLRFLQDTNHLSDDFYLSVNVSNTQLEDQAFVQKVHDTLLLTGADPARLLIEITESTLMNDIDANIRLLNQLGELGLKIAVDDFGTGHSSLAQLTHVPVSTLKVDRLFVNNIDIDKRSQMLSMAIIQMAHTLGLEVIAEGVETESQRDILRFVHCDFAQGYLYSKPLLLDDLIAFKAPKA